MLKTLFNHRSIRKFKPEIIPESILDSILEAGTMASTTGNMQVYSIVVTTKADIKNQLWEAHFKQNMVKEAPVVLTFCADFNRFNKWCLQREATPGYDNFLSFFTAAIDALLASQNCALAAEANGLGICYLGTTTYLAQKIINILDLPLGVVPVTTMVMGYPNENPPLTGRLPLRAVVHKEKYQDFSNEDINMLYHEREASEESVNLLKVNNKKTLAQIFTDNRYSQKDNVLFSKMLIEVLQNQGFMNQ